jgi:competence protein ComEA
MELPALTVARRRLLAAGVLMVVVVVLATRFAGHRGGSSASFVPVRPVPASAGIAQRRLVVDVVGAVRRPGLYRLARGTRVADAVAAAGGLAARAERTGVNLAAPVADGQQVVVPARVAGGVGGSVAGASASASAGPVSLSVATPEQLDALPGIGPSTAAKILAFRQQHGAFRSVEELDAVPGIGPARIAELKGLVVP